MVIPILGAVLGAMGTAAGGVASAGVRGAIGQAAGSVAKSAEDKAVRDGIIKGPKSMRVTAQKSLQKLTGIQFSSGAIAKQSQLMAGVAGSLFQILGAFVDIMLMPLMPVFAKLLTWMGSGIPKLADLISRITGYFSDVWNTSNGLMEFFGRIVGDLYGKLYKFLLGMAWEVIKFAINPLRWVKLLIDIATFLAELAGKIIRGIFDFFWGMYSEIFKELLEPIMPMFNWMGEMITTAWDWLTSFSWISSIIDAIKRMFNSLVEGGGILGSFFKGLGFGGDSGNGDSTKVEVEITAGAGIDVDPQSAYSSSQKVTVQQEARMFDTGASLGGGP
ncbi:MAG TPA: hypothetical protein DCM40_46620 [Maribacter sp.]|nr:hypothetical protein [Maribacter sp.]